MVGGGIGTIVVVAVVAALWPALARLDPLHTLKPLEPDPAARIHPCIRKVPARSENPGIRGGSAPPAAGSCRSPWPD